MFKIVKFECDRCGLIIEYFECSNLICCEHFMKHDKSKSKHYYTDEKKQND